MGVQFISKMFVFVRIGIKDLDCASLLKDRCLQSCRFALLNRHSFIPAFILTMKLFLFFFQLWKCAQNHFCHDGFAAQRACAVTSRLYDTADAACDSVKDGRAAHAGPHLSNFESEYFLL